MLTPKLREAADKNKLLISDIRKLAEEKKLHSLYVFNVADMHNQRDPGVLNIPVKIYDEQVNIRIPDTFIPIEVSQYGDLDVIIKSNLFVQSIAKGHILPVKEDYALEVLSTPIAQAEMTRLQLAAVGGNIEAVNEELDIERRVNARVMGIMEDPDKNERTKMLELMNTLHLLTKDDCTYILGKAESDDLRRVVTDRMKDIEASPATATQAA